MNHNNLSLKKGLLKKYVSQLYSLVSKGSTEHTLIKSLVKKIKLLIYRNLTKSNYYLKTI